MINCSEPCSGPEYIGEGRRISGCLPHHRVGLITSPLGLYYITGVVVHSDDSPQAALEWFQHNEGPEADIFQVGGIQLDSSVIFAGGPPVYFNAKTRKLQIINPSTSGRRIIGFREWFDGDTSSWAPLVTSTDGSPSFFLEYCRREAKLDALMAAMEYCQST